MLEGGIRVPFLLTWPGTLKPAVFPKMVSQLDLNATALAAAGAAQNPDWKIEGSDLIPFINATKAGEVHDHQCWRFGDQMAIRSGDWKLVKYDAVVDQAKGVSTEKLYNLATDIHEDKDLSATEPGKLQELKAKWSEWDKANIRPLWGKGGGE